ncbi:MAG: hypothetical protein ABSD59_02420 [Terracidiphilus sp.]
MPSKDQHVKKATDNEVFANRLDTNTQASINWKLIVLFYTALHYVEAYLAKALGQHLRVHTTRDSIVSRETHLRAIRTEYAHLKYYGFNARYEADQFTSKDVTDALGYLALVKGKIAPLL